MNRAISLGIIVAVFAALAGYLLLPDDKQKQLIEASTKVKADLDKISQIICSENNDGYREYFIGMLKNEYQDQNIEDLCDNAK